MGVYVAGGVSGAHLNPAVTLTLAVRARFPVEQSASVLRRAAGRGVHRRARDVRHVSRGVRSLRRRRAAGRRSRRATAGIFATYPQAFLSTFPGGLIDQIVGTALLLLLIFAISDTKNLAPDPKFAPVVVGLIVTVIGMTFGFNAGYAINPARDLGPRLFTAVAGWGSEVFRAGNGWWWVPIAGPLIGGVVGGFVYDLFVTNPRRE